MSRRLPMAEWCTLVGALVVRVAALSTFSGTPWSRYPMVDAYVYWQQSLDLLAGRDPFGEGFYQPPGYPAVLWVLGKLTAGGDLASVRIFQLVLGMLTTWAVIVVGRRLGRHAGAPWAGVVAGLLYTLYPTTLFFELDILTPAVTSACLSGALVALATEDGSLPAAWRVALSGLAMGFAVVVHPTYLLPALVMVAWLGWRHWSRGVWMAVALAACLAPTTARNLEQFGTPTLVSHNAGINLYLGNNPGWRETAFLRPGLPFRQVALEAEPDRRNVSERNRYWRSRTWSEIAGAPDAWGAALMTKALWSVNETEVPRNEDYRCRTVPGEAMRWVGLLPVRFGWVFPLAVVGAVVTWRRSRLPALLWVSLHLPLVIFMVADRYRLGTWPLVVVLAPLGAAAIVRMAREWREGRRPERAWLLLPVLVVLPWVPIDPRTAMSEAACAYAAGNLAYMQEDWATAEAAYRRVVQDVPRDMGAHAWLSQLAEKRDDLPEAIEHLAVVLDQFPDHFPSLKQMARLHEKVRDRAGAIEYYRRAHAVPGDRSSTWARLVELLVETGQVDEAKALVAADEKLARSKKVRAALDL